MREKEKELAEQAPWSQQNPDLDSPSFLLQQPLRELNIRFFSLSLSFSNNDNDSFLNDNNNNNNHKFRRLECLEN